MYTEYHSNNSGGGWWLADDDWRALEAAGWVVAWESKHHTSTPAGDYIRRPDGVPMLEDGPDKWTEQDKRGEYRRLRALASRAYRPGLGLREAAAEWERVTGKDSTDAGCPCCGQPHNFTEYDDNGKYVNSGPDAEYSAHWED